MSETTDAVAQAREKVMDKVYFVADARFDIKDASNIRTALDALILAVRAECAAPREVIQTRIAVREDESK